MNHHHQQQHHHGQLKNNIFPHQREEQPSNQLVTNIHDWLGVERQIKLTSRDIQRRTKRTVPEMEKDDKYWEKRKRNNMAAQRSRENKRLLEKDIKHKVSCLEEQNALLRKEIVLIKSRVGIPLDQSFLTPEERAQCVMEVQQEQQYNRARQRKDSGTDDVTSTSQTNDPVAAQQRVRSRRESSGSCNSSPNLHEESSTSGLNATSHYGNITSSPKLSFASISAISSFSRNDSSERYSPEDLTTFVDSSLAFQEQSSKISSHVNERRNTNFIHSHFANQNRRQLYRGGNEERVTTAVDWGIARGQRFEHMWLESGVLDLVSNSGASRSVPSTSNGVICPENVSSGHVAHCPEQYGRGLRLPTQGAPFSSPANNLPNTSTHYSNVNKLRTPQQPRPDHNTA